MELSAVTQARVVGFIEILDLSAGGKIFYPDLVSGLVERLRFQKFPETLKEFDEQKGIEFIGGQWNGTTVEKLIIFWNGFVLDTHVSTSESERILDEALVWASEKFQIKYKSGMISRKRYVSDLTFYSEKRLLNLHPALPRLTSNLHHKLKEITGQEFTYEATRLDVDFCKFERALPIAPFTIQRRTETPFEENKYFSEAPLPTDIHLELLQAFEADLHEPIPQHSESSNASEGFPLKPGARKFQVGDE